MSFKNIIIEGKHVRLEPLDESHLTGLAAAIKDGQLHQLMVTNVPRPDDLEQFLSNAQIEQQIGQSLVFITIDQQSNQVIGSSRFMHTDWNYLSTEIGFTFIAKSKQRTAANTEVKLLMLQHAFETLKLNRVAFVTDFLNLTSRIAILRLGAKQQGILCNHMVMSDDRIRESIFFSIIKNEWSGIKSFLLEKLKQ